MIAMFDAHHASFTFLLKHVQPGPSHNMLHALSISAWPPMALCEGSTNIH